MSDFERGISQLEEVALRVERERAARTRDLLGKERRLGLDLRPGDRVLDKLTRRIGHVLSLGVRNFQTPPARGR